MTDEGYVPSRRPELFEDAEADPYADEDLGTYPDWWRENVLEFNAHGLRPYRPPRFADGSVTTETIRTLEAAHDVAIRLRCADPTDDDRWAVVVGDETVARVDRRRDGEGYTVYDVTADEFAAIVADAAE